MSVKEILSEFLTNDEKMAELVKETFPNPGGKSKLKDIQPSLKQYIDAHDSGSSAMTEEQREALRAKHFTARAEEELDEAEYKEFLKGLLNELLTHF